jgi:hypothetical protein
MQAWRSPGAAPRVAPDAELHPRQEIRVIGDKSSVDRTQASR